jgi:signal transduction histidine kinase
MNRFQFSRPAGPLIALGGLVAVTCLASTWYINRLQSDLARTVHRDVVSVKAANELQLRLRQLRVHALLHAADPTSARRQEVNRDIQRVRQALAETPSPWHTPEERAALDAVFNEYLEYEAGLELSDDPPPAALSGRDLAAWADAHQVQGLLDRCRAFEDLVRERMDASIAGSESQTMWAGRALVSLGLAGALGGVLSGYATARGLTRRAAELSVRVRAVQAELDQEVAAMTVERPQSLEDLDAQLDLVVSRVREVCQRLQEQERDLLRAEHLGAMGHLAAGVAHEIRNPLTGIKILVEGALRPNSPTQLSREDLTLVHQELARIERTIQGLLDFARRPPLDRRRHDLRVLMEEAAGLVRKRAAAKPVQLVVERGESQLPAEVDRDQFLSMMTNLLYNAIEATPPGGEVRVVGTRCANGTNELTVTDTGPGFDPGIVDRLFTPFTTTKLTGTGLGLTVAQRVARDHGGTLAAANGPRGGACLTVRLPAPA